MYYLKDIETNEVVRHAEKFNKAESLQKYLRDKGTSTIITKNDRVIVDYESHRK